MPRGLEYQVCIQLKDRRELSCSVNQVLIPASLYQDGHPLRQRLHLIKAKIPGVLDDLVECLVERLQRYYARVRDEEPIILRSVVKDVLADHLDFSAHCTHYRVQDKLEDDRAGPSRSRSSFRPSDA